MSYAQFVTQRRLRRSSGSSAAAFLYRAGDSFAAIGLTEARTTAALYRDQAGTWQSAAAAVPRDGHWQYTSSGSFRTLLREGASTNSALGSCSLRNATYWTNLETGVQSDATSCIAGQTATTWTDPSVGVATRQSIGTFVNGQTDCYWVIVEKGASPVTTSSFGIFDTTAAAYLARITLTWSTMALSDVVAPASKGVISLGNNLYIIYMTATGTGAGTGAAGNTRTINFTPSASGAGTFTMHHAQFEANASYPSSPIVTVAGAVTRAADLILVSHPYAPAAGTWYLSAYDLKASAATQTALWLGKNDASTAPYFSVADASTKWQSRVAMAAGNSDSAAATATTYGQLVELRPILAVSGGNITSQLGQSINGAAEAVAAAGTARALDAAWATPTKLYIGSTGAGTLGANLAIRSLCFVLGPEQSMANMRLLINS